MASRIFLLGATGSVGTSALDALRKLRLPLEAFTFHKNISRAESIIREFSPKYVVAFSEENFRILKKKYPRMRLYFSMEGLLEVLTETPVTHIINALAGMSGLRPSYETLKSGKNLIIANKESIVAGSGVLLKEQKYENQLIPIDSEHWSLFLLLDNIKREKVKEIILTASGGPFRNHTPREMENIRLEDALKHPVWQMGNSITIGSACMSNKGLEILEGKELFNFPVDQIQVLIHPQAKIHGMVRLTDGSLIAHIGETSMAEPVRNALTYPEMEKNRDYDLAGEKLDFEKADYEKFPMLDLAYEAGRKGHFYQIAYTVANDVGIEYFLNRRLHFNEIGKGVRSVFNDLKPFPLNKLDDIFKAEEEIRLASHRIFKEKSI